ncbi:MAG: bifunctional nicotinamidase/pyrazinamidase [Phycisphaerae bacterium]
MDALLIVDVQNDFVSGALAIDQAEQIIEPINRLIPRFELVIATRDWHPKEHVSFAGNHEGKQVGDVVEVRGLQQDLWPDHCVQGTWGAQLVDDLDAGKIDAVIDKGTDPELDSYSALYDNGHVRQTDLPGLLRDRGVDRIHVAGLATDFCVKFTVLDAIRKLGLDVVLIADACRPVDLQEGDGQAAIREMSEAGAKITTAEALCDG